MEILSRLNDTDSVMRIVSGIEDVGMQGGQRFGPS